jgi:hypothetical protein
MSAEALVIGGLLAPSGAGQKKSSQAFDGFHRKFSDRRGQIPTPALMIVAF